MKWKTTLLQWLGLLMWVPFLVYWAVKPAKRKNCRHLHVAGLLQTAMVMFITFCWVGHDNCQHLVHQNLSLLHGVVVWLVMHFCWLSRFLYVHGVRTFLLWLVLQLHIALFWIDSQVVMLVLQLAFIVVDVAAFALCFRDIGNADDDYAMSTTRKTAAYFVLQSWPVAILAEGVILGVGTGREDVDRFLAVLVLALLGGSQLWFADRQWCDDNDDDEGNEPPSHRKSGGGGGKRQHLRADDSAYWEAYFSAQDNHPELPVAASECSSECL